MGCLPLLVLKRVVKFRLKKRVVKVKILLTIYAKNAFKLGPFVGGLIWPDKQTTRMSNPPFPPDPVFGRY